MKHKGQGMQFLHPGDLKRYYKEKDFKWEDIRKIIYYPEEMAEQTEEEKHLQKAEQKSETDTSKEAESTMEEIKEFVHEYLTEDRIFEEGSRIINQKKKQRVVINMPGWLKERLKKKSVQTGTSMNAIVRLALTEYLSKDEK
jgi:hypothetical protein